MLADFGDNIGHAARQQKQALALKAAKVDAELASKAKSEFIANMSHELRTPLNAIIGFSEMLQGKAVGPEKVPEYAGYIHEAAQHLLSLINGILDVSKIQAGKLSVDPQPITLDDLLESCLLITGAKAKERNISITSNIPADLPLLLADPLRLKQILINLLSNAVKFTPDWGKISVDAASPHPGFCTISVADNGPGMTPKEIDTALSPFGQVDSELNKTTEGTGLGLPIAQALARMHGGDLHVKSEKDIGTTIIVHIPLAVQSAEHV